MAELIAQLWSRQPSERPDTTRLLDQIKQLIHQYTSHKELWDAAVNSAAPLSEDEDEDEKSPRDPKKARRTLSKDKADKKKVANAPKDKRRN